MPRTIQGCNRDELEGLVDFVRGHCQEDLAAYPTEADRKVRSERDGELFYAAKGALSIAGSLGMFNQATVEHPYLDPLLDVAVLSLEEAKKLYCRDDRVTLEDCPCKHEECLAYYTGDGPPRWEWIEDGKRREKIACGMKGR